MQRTKPPTQATTETASAGPRPSALKQGGELRPPSADAIAPNVTNVRFSRCRGAMLRIGTAAGDGQDLANDACEKRPLPPPRAAFRNPSAGRAVCVVSISFHGCHSRHGGVRFGENEDHERVVRLKPLLLGAPVELDTDWGRGVVARRAEGEGDLADESVRLVDRDER
eukprot:4464717-Pleurochrysis_carterae.AAC.1